MGSLLNTKEILSITFKFSDEIYISHRIISRFDFFIGIENVFDEMEHIIGVEEYLNDDI